MKPVCKKSPVDNFVHQPAALVLGADFAADQVVRVQHVDGKFDEHRTYIQFGEQILQSYACHWKKNQSSDRTGW